MLNSHQLLNFQQEIVRYCCQFRDRKDLKDNEEKMVNLDHRDPEESRDNQEILVTVENLDPLVLMVSLGPEENQDHQAHQVNLVTKDHRVNVVNQDSQDHKVNEENPDNAEKTVI